MESPVKEAYEWWLRVAEEQYDDCMGCDDCLQWIES